MQWKRLSFISLIMLNILLKAHNFKEKLFTELKHSNSTTIKVEDLECENNSLFTFLLERKYLIFTLKIKQKYII